jgi:zinc transporter, ZIP family
MTDALLAGLLAASSLLIGAVLAMVHRVQQRTLGLIMAFGSGVLISAVAYDLVADAVEFADGRSVVQGLFVGAATFFVGDLLIERRGGGQRKSATGPAVSSSASAIVLGTILDGIPESIVLGLTILSGEGLSVAMLVAVFLSNLPEAMSSTAGFLASDTPRSRILWLWIAVVLVSGLSSMLGYAVFGDSSPETIAFVQGFAAGAILTMLADTMMPEAYENGGPVVGLFTTMGFALAFLIATLEGKS